MTDIVARRPNRRPTHPGAILRETVIPASGMGMKAVADALGVTRQQLHRLLTEQAAVSPVMAHRLGKLCGNGPELWARMQLACDLWDAKQEIGASIDAVPTLKA